MRNRILAGPACLFLFPALVVAQQPASRDPLMENLDRKSVV